MKNSCFALLLVVLCSSITANDNDGPQLAVVLSQTGNQLYVINQDYQTSLPSQKSFIKRICWLFKNNPLFYKMYEFRKNIDYAIAVFNNHIEKLQNKIASKENGLKSDSMCIGAVTGIVSALCAYATYYFLNYRGALLSGKSAPPLGSNVETETLNAMAFAVHSGLASLLTGAVAGKKFYNVYHYQERIAERLERDKKILALLQAEKKLLDNK